MTQQQWRRMMVVSAVLGACALSGCALSGCADRRIDLRNVEAAMRDRYARDASVPIEDVTCPEWVPTREDDKFECQVRFEGGVTWTIEVVQGDVGSTQWLPRGQAVFAVDIEPWLAGTLAAEGQASEVACAARVYVIEPGQHITCTATDAQGQASEVRIGFEPAQGLRVVE